MDDDLLRLVKTFRVMSDNELERVRLANAIFDRIEPDLRYFVFAALRPEAAEDVSQEMLKAIALGLPKFKGNTKEAFWAWCYSIARNKINGHLRARMADKLQPLTDDILLNLLDDAATRKALSSGDRLDLQEAVAMLTKAKPECYDLLWLHYVIGWDITEIAGDMNLAYDTVRMKINRCLDLAQSLVN